MVPSGFSTSGADPAGPLPLQGGAAVELEQVGQGDVRPHLDRLPGPLGQQPGRDQPAHRLLEGVVVALLLRAGVLGPGRRRQRLQHRAHHRGALRGQVPGQHPRTLERGLQPDGPVLQRPVRILIGQVGPGPLVHLGDQRGQVRQPQPGRRRRDQQLVGLLPVLLRQLVRPRADRPAVRLGDLPGGQRRQHPGVRGSPAGPGGVVRRRAAGDPGPVHQPGPHAVIRVRPVPLADGERGQEASPRRGGDRIGLLEPL